ncbi:hypothetical protein BGZ63DRAFT_387620 [Mariannaea sp. PMI_226]|nr:hypothetical protein BGZ63DRAFT_387620 [Mariannaea sp. PMI_226]
MLPGKPGNDTNREFRMKLDTMPELNHSVFGVCYASASHVALIDLSPRQRSPKHCDPSLGQRWYYLINTY